ncbi:MAG: hypothetical protein JXR48_17875 [Candidatus Delongbacteria bacterium]|nr:hypothetical protein [Candidatus Delongbacteria bacterium]MBN2836828.1 hypothetical protein [Candidatus Delongbacteria bacterium]
MYLKESEIIKFFIENFTAGAKEKYDFNAKIKKPQWSEPSSTDLYKSYKNGQYSSVVEFDFELYGWSGFADDELESHIKATIDDDENLYPIVGFELYDLGGKGKKNVKIIFKFVYTGLDALKTNIDIPKASNTPSVKTGVLNNSEKNEIIREIEVKISEVFTLLSKLKNL